MAKVALKVESGPSVNPAAGYVYVYPKVDGNLYVKNDAGVEYLIGGVSAGVTSYDDLLDKPVLPTIPLGTRIFNFIGPLHTSVGTSRFYPDRSIAVSSVFASVGVVSNSATTASIKKNGTAAATINISAGQFKSSVQVVDFSVTPDDFLTVDIIGANGGENLTITMVYS